MFPVNQYCRVAITIALSIVGQVATSPPVPAAPATATTPPPTSATSTAAAPRYRTTVPFTSLNRDAPGTVFVSVLINDRIHAVFMVDTGSDDCCITEALANKLGLMPPPAQRPDSKSALYVTVPSLRVGNFSFNNSPCLIVSDQNLAGISVRAVDGILGANALRLYPTLFDFQAHSLTLFSPSPLTVQEIADAGMADAVAVPLTETVDYQYRCRVELRSGSTRVQADLLVDTGGEHTLLSADAARRLALAPISGERSYQSIYGPVPVSVSNVDALSLGLLSVARLVVLFPRGPLPDRFGPHLGRDVLAHFRVLLDFQQRVMYLKPVPALPAGPSGLPPPVARGSRGH